MQHLAHLVLISYFDRTHTNWINLTETTNPQSVFCVCFGDSKVQESVINLRVKAFAVLSIKVQLFFFNHGAVNGTLMLFDPGYVKSMFRMMQGTIYRLTQLHKQSETQQFFVSKSFYG